MFKIKKQVSKDVYPESVLDQIKTSEHTSDNFETMSKTKSKEELLHFSFTGTKEPSGVKSTHTV